VCSFDTGNLTALCATVEPMQRTQKMCDGGGVLVTLELPIVVVLNSLYIRLATVLR